MKIFMVIGSLKASVAVIMGAFGAHALREKLTTDMMSVYQTAVQYHFFHALGLFVVAFVVGQYPHVVVSRWSGWLMLIGILLFSGSLYGLSLSGTRWLGAITPMGGTAFIISWTLLAIAVGKG